MSKYFEEFSSEYVTNTTGEVMTPDDQEDTDEDAFCCETFFSEADYIKHKFEEHAGLNSSYEDSEEDFDNNNSDESDYFEDECLECEVIFPDMTSLMNHYNTAHEIESFSNNDKDVSVTNKLCLQCGVSFSDLDALKKHCTLFHIDKNAENIVPVNEYKKKSSRDYVDKDVLELSENVEDISVNYDVEGEECPDCDIFFTDIVSLIAHYKTVHENYDIEHESNSFESSVLGRDILESDVINGVNDVKIQSDLFQLNEKSRNSTETLAKREDIHEQNIFKSKDKDIIKSRYKNFSELQDKHIFTSESAELYKYGAECKLDSEDITKDTRKPLFEMKDLNREKNAYISDSDDDSEYSYDSYDSDDSDISESEFIQMSQNELNGSKGNNRGNNRFDSTVKYSPRSEHIDTMKSKYFSRLKNPDIEEDMLDSEDEEDSLSYKDTLFNKNYSRSNKLYYDSESEEDEEEDFDIEGEYNGTEDKGLGQLYDQEDISASRKKYIFEDYEDLSDSDEDFYDSEDDKDSSEHEIVDLLDLHIKESNLPLVRLGKTLSDGNCWYDATSDQVILHNIPGMPTDHVNLRKTVCKALPKLPQANMWRECFFGNSEKKFKKFVEKHGRSGEWTDDQGIMCQATALVLRRNIHIVGTANRGTSVSFTKLEGGEGADRFPPLTVGYYQDLHYQSLQTIEQRDGMWKVDNKNVKSEQLFDGLIEKMEEQVETLEKEGDDYLIEPLDKKHHSVRDEDCSPQATQKNEKKKISKEMIKKWLEEDLDLKVHTDKLDYTLESNENCEKNEWPEEDDLSDDLIETDEDEEDDLIDPISMKYNAVRDEDYLSQSTKVSSLIEYDEIDPENMCNDIVNDLILSLEREVQLSIERRCDNIINEVIESAINLGEQSVKKECDKMFKDIVYSAEEETVNNNNVGISADKSVDLVCCESDEGAFTSVEHNLVEMFASFENKGTITNSNSQVSNIEDDTHPPIISYHDYSQSYVVNENSLLGNYQQLTDKINEGNNIVVDKFMDGGNFNVILNSNGLDICALAADDEVVSGDVKNDLVNNFVKGDCNFDDNDYGNENFGHKILANNHASNYDLHDLDDTGCADEKFGVILKENITASDCDLNELVNLCHLDDNGVEITEKSADNVKNAIGEEKTILCLNKTNFAKDKVCDNAKSPKLDKVETGELKPNRPKKRKYVKYPENANLSKYPKLCLTE